MELIKLRGWNLLPVGADKPGCYHICSAGADKSGGWSLLPIFTGEPWKWELLVDVIFKNIFKPFDGFSLGRVST